MKIVKEGTPNPLGECKRTGLFQIKTVLASRASVLPEVHEQGIAEMRRGLARRVGAATSDGRVYRVQWSGPVEADGTTELSAVVTLLDADEAELWELVSCDDWIVYAGNGVVRFPALWPSDGTVNYRQFTAHRISLGEGAARNPLVVWERIQ